MKTHHVWFGCLLVIVVLLLLAILFVRGFNAPPNVNSVKQHFLNNYDDIQTVVDFMINSGYENIYIMDTSGTMLADLTRIQISDDEMLKTVIELLETGKYTKICKIQNTIWFLQWTGIRDIGCGITYTINGTDLPEVQFTTELIPISENGWFYYVSDYEVWRNNNRAE